jgi:hypothetical protein
MWLRRKDRGTGQTAVEDPPGTSSEDPGGSLEELQEELARLVEANGAERDSATERRILRLRHLAAMRRIDAPPEGADYAAPDFDGLPSAGGVPEIAGAEVTPGLLRAGILRDGCLLVRGLVERGAAERLAAGIDRAFAERARFEAGEPHAEAYYEDFEPHPRFGGVGGRDWIRDGGGVLAADSPRLAFDWMQMLAAGGLPQLVEGYLGEPALTSVQKTTLRKAAPTVAGAWHQDGNFMGAVRSVNLWLSLSRCGDVAPGLDLVPRRLEHLVATQTDEALLDIQVSQAKAEEAAAGKPIVRPIFEPGDALFFDELFLHKTGSDPSMPNPRFAVENWFFGAASFPSDYAPLTIT